MYRFFEVYNNVHHKSSRRRPEAAGWQPRVVTGSGPRAAALAAPDRRDPAASRILRPSYRAGQWGDPL